MAYGPPGFVVELRVSISILTGILIIVAGLSRTLVTLAYLLLWWGVFCKRPQHVDKVNRLGEIIGARTLLPLRLQERPRNDTHTSTLTDP